ncbi:MAG: Mur ligase family protein [Saprospiraceae bacterium]
MTSIPALYSIFQKHPLISTDSRQLSARCIFFALKEGSVDGNQFADQALKNGADFAVIDNPAYHTNERCLLVPDVLKALQQLANYHRRQFEIPVIAIAGSKGKTITQKLISSILSAHYPCHFTKGNLSNHLGVPLTLLSMPRDTEVAILEMDSNKPGDIEVLCKIVQPTHGLVTDTGEGRRKGFENFAELNSDHLELFDYLAQNHGCAFVNLTEYQAPVSSEKAAMHVGYRRCETLRPDTGIIEIQWLADNPFIRAAFLSDDGPRIEITTQFCEDQSFQYVMAAMALGIYFKVPAERIKEVLENYSAKNSSS